jgi:hypothetical protein
LQSRPTFTPSPSLPLWSLHLVFSSPSPTAPLHLLYI